MRGGGGSVHRLTYALLLDGLFIICKTSKSYYVFFLVIIKFEELTSL